MRRLFLLLFLSLMTPSAYPVDGVYMEYGRGNTSLISTPAMAKMYRIGATWNWDRSWLNDGNWHVTGFWDVSLAQWHGEKPGDSNQTVTDFGITPVFRLAQKERAAMASYLEAGLLGIHLISPTYLYSDRRFSTAFQFGHILGFGISLGEIASSSSATATSTYQTETSNCRTTALISTWCTLHIVFDPVKAVIACRHIFTAPSSPPPVA